MNIQKVLVDLEEAGIQIKLRDTDLGVSPIESITPEIRALIKGNKQGIIDELRAVDMTASWGPGTELVKLIPNLFQTGGCNCKDYAKKMDQWGVEGSKKRFNQIVQHLTDQARRNRFAKVFPYVVTTAVAQRWVNVAIESAAKSRKTVVWVYWQGGAEGEELRYSMRSAIANLPDAFNVVICGDKPNWYTGDFIHSPRYNKQDAKKEFGSGRFSKWIDSVVKLERIKESPLVTDSFLWMYDDTFIVKPTTISALSFPRAGGELYPSAKYRKRGRGAWREVRRRTHISLEERGLPTRDYSTHMPIVFDKDKLGETFAVFDPRTKARVIESLYQNHHAGRTPLSVSKVLQYAKRIKAGWKVHPKVTVVNVGGFNDIVEAEIMPMFTEAAEHERY